MEPAGKFVQYEDVENIKNVEPNEYGISKFPIVTENIQEEYDSDVFEDQSTILNMDSLAILDLPPSTSEMEKRSVPIGRKPISFNNVDDKNSSETSSTSE